MKYRRKSSNKIVEAEQWVPGRSIDGLIDRRYYGYIPNRDCDYLVQSGDWIITDQQGKKYPCQPHVFTQLYEPLEG